MRMIRNSIGSRMFRNSYMKIGHKTIDILEDGNLSCAFYVSSLLLLFPELHLITTQHGTVAGALHDMKKSGWRETKTPRPGAVILWEKKSYADNYAKSDHQHLGFYLGEKKAISNSNKQRMPALHNLTFGEGGTKKFRKIEKFFWNKKLKD